MSRIEANTPSMEGLSPVAPEQEQANRLLRLYRVGQELLRRRQAGEPAAIDQECREFGLSKAYVHLAIAFATAYDERGLGELLAGRNRRGRPLTPAHVRALLAVAPAGLRRTFQVQALEQSWSARELARRVRLHFGGRRSAGGRPPSAGSELGMVLLEAETECCLWLARYHASWQGAFGAGRGRGLGTSRGAHERVRALRGLLSGINGTSAALEAAVAGMSRSARSCNRD